MNIFLDRYGCLAHSEEGPEFRDYRVIWLQEAEESLNVTLVLVVSGFLVLSLLLLGLVGYILVLKRTKLVPQPPSSPPVVAQDR